MSRRTTLARDRRYCIAREFCGYTKPQHVARFCDEWIGCAPTKGRARDLVAAHRARRANAIAHGG